MVIYTYRCQLIDKMQNRPELIKTILEYGYRIFTLKQFSKIAVSLGYSNLSIGQLLFEMKQSGIVKSIKPGLFQLNDSYLSSPVTGYEIAIAVVQEGYLSHLSAVTLHQLTDQLPNIIYVSVELGHGRYSNKKSEFNFEAKNYRYQIIEVSKNRIFGVEKKWFGDAQISLTNLERTLIDCLNNPEYSGGFYEVISYFDQSKSIVDLHKLIDYAVQTSRSCLQRLGWCFEKISFTEGAESVLQKINTEVMIKLDSSGYRRGSYNKKWKVIENI